MHGQTNLRRNCHTIETLSHLLITDSHRRLVYPGIAAVSLIGALAAVKILVNAFLDKTIEARDGLRKPRGIKCAGAGSRIRMMRPNQGHRYTTMPICGKCVYVFNGCRTLRTNRHADTRKHKTQSFFFFRLPIWHAGSRLETLIRDR